MISSRFSSSPLSRQYALTTRGQGKDSVGSAAGLDAEHIEPGNCLKSSPVLYIISSTPCAVFAELKGMHVEHLGRSHLGVRVP